MNATEFIVGSKRQEEWGWLVIVDMFLTGAGSGLFFIGLMMSSTNHMLFGLLTVLIGAVILSAHLMHPLQSWRVFLRPATSWISRGAIGMLASLIFGSAYTVVLAARPEWRAWQAGTAWMVFLGLLAGCSALFVSLYPGLLLNSMRSISLWRNTLLPILFSISALLCGLGLYYLIPSSIELSASGRLLVYYFSIGLIILGFIILSVLMLVKPMTILSQDSNGENRSKIFKAYIVVIFITEILIPIIAVFMVMTSNIYPILILIAGVSLAISSLLIRLFVVRSGFRVSPV